MVPDAILLIKTLILVTDSTSRFKLKCSAPPIIVAVAAAWAKSSGFSTVKLAVPVGVATLNHSIVPEGQTITSPDVTAVPERITTVVAPTATLAEAAAVIATAEEASTEAIDRHWFVAVAASETSTLYSVPFVPNAAEEARPCDMKMVAFLTLGVRVRILEVV